MYYKTYNNQESLRKLYNKATKATANSTTSTSNSVSLSQNVHLKFQKHLSKFTVEALYKRIYTAALVWTRVSHTVHSEHIHRHTHIYYIDDVYYIVYSCLGLRFFLLYILYTRSKVVVVVVVVILYFLDFVTYILCARGRCVYCGL